MPSDLVEGRLGLQPNGALKYDYRSPVLSYNVNEKQACADSLRARDPRQLYFPSAQPFLLQLTVQLLPTLVQLIAVVITQNSTP